VSPRMVGQEHELTQPYWEGTKRKELVLQFCPTCDAPVHYPRELCPRCFNESLEWRTVPGNGEVYAFTVIHRAGPGMDDRAPYVVALVTLTEGTRMMSNVIGCPPDDVKVGMPVKLTWEDLEDGRALPQFEPA